MRPLNSIYMNNDLKSNLNVKEAVSFFMIVSMANSLNFYVNALGFELKNKWELEVRPGLL